MKTLSLVMIVKNEEETLQRCLDSVMHWVDEIIIVDTGSIDSTKAIAKQYTSKIYDYVWNDSFSDARNEALSYSTSDWNIVLDADEYFTEDNHQIIRDFIEGEYAIGKFKIVNKTLQDNQISYVQNFISRLFPAGLKYIGRIHEQLNTDLPRKAIPIEVQHDGYYQKNKGERNIPLLQLELQEDPQNSYYLYQLAKEYRGMNKLDEAVKSMDEAYSSLASRESFAPMAIVELLYLYKDTGKYEEGFRVIESQQHFLHDYPDFHFIRGLFYLEAIISDIPRYGFLLPKIKEAYETCLKIGETDKYDSVKGTGSYSALHNLGVFYQVQGDVNQAIEYYTLASRYDYAPSVERLNELMKG